MEPLLRRLRDERTSPALRGIPFVGRLAVRVSAFADDVTVFASRRQRIEAVKEAVVEYERIAGAKVNFEKAKVCGLVLGGVALLFQGPSAGVRDPSASSGCGLGPDLQLERNWSEVHAKVNAQVGIWLSRRLSLKGRGGGVRRVHPPFDPLPIGCTSSA